MNQAHWVSSLSQRHQDAAICVVMAFSCALRSPKVTGALRSTEKKAVETGRVRDGFDLAKIHK